MKQELNLWSMEGSGKAKPIDAIERMPDEKKFEDYLVSNPDMLENGLRLVSRQARNESGQLDLLGVDRNGGLVVYELKRGTLTREAVAQVLDYASLLESLNEEDLVKHISEHSGKDGIERIDDFRQWYSRHFDTDELSQLLPPRTVLIGLGVDEKAERIARFLSAAGVDFSVITFHGYEWQGKQILARMMDVSPGEDRRKVHDGTTAAERRRNLEQFLDQQGHLQYFNSVCSDISGLLPRLNQYWDESNVGYATGYRGKFGGVLKQVFRVQAVKGQGGFKVGFLQRALHWAGDEALETLKGKAVIQKRGSSIDVCFEPREWEGIREHVLEFVKALALGLNESHGVNGS